MKNPKRRFVGQTIKPCEGAPDDVLRDRRYTATTFPSHRRAQGLVKYSCAGTGRADEQLSNQTTMANTKSAKKAVRASERRPAINKNRRSRMRTSSEVESDCRRRQGRSGTALRSAQPEIMRGAQRASSISIRIAKNIAPFGTNPPARGLILRPSATHQLCCFLNAWQKPGVFIFSLH